MDVSEKTVELFKKKAELVSAFVSRVKTVQEAFGYAVDLCDRKEACQLLVSGREEPLSEVAEELCETKQQKTIAAPAGRMHLPVWISTA